MSNNRYDTGELDYDVNSLSEHRYDMEERDEAMPYDLYEEPIVVRKKKNGAKRVLLSVLLIIAVLFVAAFFLINGLISRITYEEPSDAYNPNENVSASAAAKNIPMSSGGGVTNILLLGTDEEDRGRSDTILLLSIDRKNGEVKMTSFLRDLYVEIPGHKSTKINAAYNYGKADLVIQTIESNFRIKIDAYFRLNFTDMSSLVNEVGGIECELTKDEANYVAKKTGVATPAGKSRLTGWQALWYCRIRKLDSDFGRTGRQRNFMNFMIADFKSRSLINKYSFIYDMLPYITTREDTRGKMFGFILSGIMALNYETKELTIPVDNGYTSKNISGAAMLVPDIPKNCEAIKEFIYGE